MKGLVEGHLRLNFTTNQEDAAHSAYHTAQVCVYVGGGCTHACPGGGEVKGVAQEGDLTCLGVRHGKLTNHHLCNSSRHQACFVLVLL